MQRNTVEKRIEHIVGQLMFVDGSMGGRIGDTKSSRDTTSDVNRYQFSQSGTRFGGHSKIFMNHDFLNEIITEA